MSKNSPSISKILQILRDEKMIEEYSSILTYICSNVGKTELSKIDKTQYVELCKLLLALFSKPNKITGDIKNKNMETRMALHSLFKNNSNNINFFEIISHTDKKERLTILEFLNGIEIHVLARIIQDSKSINVMSDCLKTVESDKMEWISANSYTDNVQDFIEFEKRILSVEGDTEEKLILNTLTILHRIYEYAGENSSNFNIESIHPLLFDRVISLAYMGHKRQRAPALKVLDEALNTNLISYMKDKHLSLWIRYKNTLQNVYCTRMTLLVKAAEHDWSNLWCLSIKMLGTDLHRGAELINNLLSVEERAFKSTDMTIRKKAFESWNQLIDNFSLDTAELVTSRRIKLLCIPLNAKNSKIEIVAIAKLETWWHLIIKLYLNVDSLLNQVIGQFLNFCFGPLGDTPLLSAKCDVVASPGKRFSNTKLLAVDALFQLLIQKVSDRHSIPCFIKERLPNALSSAVFQANYKSLFHSVGEAVLLISEFNEGELNNRENLNEMLWSNLMTYIQQSSAEQKADMYKELILILGGVINHTKYPALIVKVLSTCIIDKLVKVTKYLIYRDTALTDLLLQLLSPEMLKSIDKKYFNDLILLICHAVTPQSVEMYVPNTLMFIKSALGKMKLLMKEQVVFYVFKLWCTFTEIMINYIETNQQINEGTALNHNFETIQSLIMFPVQNILWSKPDQIIKISKLWRELYKQFDRAVDLITTVKPNEILHTITVAMENSLMKDKRCYSIVVHCLDPMMITVNYEKSLSESRIPPLVNLLRDITMVTITEMNESEIELALKATSSLLITVYGLNQKCALMYLEVLRPSIENILEIKNAKGIEKEIINTWQTVVIVFRGLTKLLAHDFILSYKKAFLLSLRHSNPEIVAQAKSLINIKNHLNNEAKLTLERIEKMASQISRNEVNLTQKKNEASSKRMKVTGSFLNRKISNPEAMTTKKNCDMKNMRVSSPLPPPEPDSQDYVLIKNDVRLDLNRLTEHQMESLKRHRDDIPAMYNDLSQSASRDTQQLEAWLTNKSEIVNEERSIMEKTHNNTLINNEANKENTVSCYEDPMDKNEKSDDMTIDKKLDEDKIHITNKSNLVDKSSVPINDTNTQIAAFSDNENDLIHKQIVIRPSDIGTPQITAKKLKFDSQEEFLNNKDDTVSQAQESSSRSDVIESYKQRESSEIGDNTESPSLEQLPVKRGRPRGKPIKVIEKYFRSTRLSNNCNDHSKQNLKRRNSLDKESDEFIANKRRKCIIMQQPSSGTHDDLDSIISSESENHSVTLATGDLPKRTKKEMSRLQINMVFNSKMPSKLRSKPTDDYVYGTKYTRQKNVKYEKNTSQSDSSQELVKKRRPKETRNSLIMKIESLGRNKIQTTIKPNEVEMRPEQKSTVKVESVEGIIENKNFSSTNNEPITDDCDKSEIFDQNNSLKNMETTKSNGDIEGIEDEEEVVECSQTTNSVLRSPHGKNCEKHFNSIASVSKTSPEKEKLAENPNDTSLTVNTIGLQTDNSRKSSYEDADKMVAANSNFTSPKSIKRLSRTKTFTPRGRAAHMLGLVTKLAIGEKKECRDNIKYSEDESSKQLKFSKELENDGSSIKRERTLILKEPDRIGSPSGSRQEKIFNNMKSKDYTSSPPVRLFSNLKNDGEKISPKFDKMISTEAIKISSKDYNIECNMFSEKNELPILEWSNANPPSLTASPSVSILKRQGQILADNDTDTTPSKRKRVSFADPPVSREMGYEVISEFSPIKTNRCEQLRGLIARKDTSIQLKHPRFRTIQIEVEKSIQLSNDKSNESEFANINELNHQENKLLPNIPCDSYKGIRYDGEININISDSCDHATNNVSDESLHIENSSLTSPMAVDDVNVDIIENMEIIDTDRKEIELNSFTPKEEMIMELPHSMRTDIFHSDENCNDDNELKTRTPELFSSQANHCNNSSKFNVTDDPTIARILNGSSDSCKSNGLKDTVDIQNVNNLNSTANSDEDFSGKLLRTSTQIAALNAIIQSDTLPVTDSMFLSGVMSQESLTMQQNLALSLPNTMDITKPICPTLIGCNDAIDTIVNNLVDPLWEKNLSKYFASRGINTIGDLAQLSEREAARYPVKGNAKADYIKQVLNKFSMSRLFSLEYEAEKKTLATTSKAACSTPRLNEKCSQIGCNTIKLNAEKYDNDGNNATDDIAATSFSLVNQSLVDDDIVIEYSDVSTELEGLKKCKKIEKSNAYGSIILDTSILSSSEITKIQKRKLGKVVSATIGTTLNSSSANDQNLKSIDKCVEILMNNDNPLDAIDPDLILQNAVERNSFKKIMTQCKEKMKDNPEAEFKKECLKILELEKCTETELENVCRDYGLTKILDRLPKIYHADNQFFIKVFNTYCKKLTAEECINALDLNQVKKVLCEKCSSSELCQMLLSVLINEEENGINESITESSCLRAMLKRMPIDSIINHTVANEELIPSSFVLEIALKNNTSTAIWHALDTQYPTIVKNIIDQNISADTIISHINKTELPKHKLVDIYRAICDKLSPIELLDAHTEIMKKKWNSHNINDAQ